MATKTQDPIVTAGAAWVKKVELCGKFLVKYGVNIEGMSDKEIVEKVERINEAMNSSAQVLSRGQVNDALELLLKKIPKGFVGEFKRNSDTGIQRAEALGWKVFLDEKSKEEKSDSPTGTADGTVRLGDLILMYMPDEKYIGHNLARQARIQQRRKGRDPKVSGPMQGDGVEQADPLFPILNIGG